MLEALGLSTAAEALYRALLTNGPTIETRLGDLVGHDLDAALAALTELQSAELVQRISGEPDCWLAGSPEVALASLVVQQQEVLLERQRDLERAQGTVSELIRLSRSRAPGGGGDVVEVTADAEATRRRRRHFERTTERSVMALEKLPQAGAATEEPAALAMLDRGIEVQSVYERAVLLVPGRFDTLRKLAGVGEQARTLPTLPMDLVVFDRAHAMVRLDDDEVASSALFVHHSGLLSGLLSLFELLWERAVPIPPEPDVPVEERSPETDDVLLSLLAAGFKDESIARHLHISPSTVTRRMARLMEITGTSTRFQLGMQAVRRGWI
jgi:DNA-binding CsgD family transcriptional regulator